MVPHSKIMQKSSSNIENISKICMNILCDLQFLQYVFFILGILKILYMNIIAIETQYCSVSLIHFKLIYCSSNNTTHTDIFFFLNAIWFIKTKYIIMLKEQPQWYYIRMNQKAKLKWFVSLWQYICMTYFLSINQIKGQRQYNCTHCTIYTFKILHINKTQKGKLKYFIQ